MKIGKESSLFGREKDKALCSNLGMLTNSTLPVSGSTNQDVQTKARYAQNAKIPAKNHIKTPKNLKSCLFSLFS